MSNENTLSLDESVQLIEKGPKAWNAWRKSNPSAFPILDGIELFDKDLSGIDFSRLSIKKAIINQCNFSNASLISCNLKASNLRGNNFSSAKMIAVRLQDADLSDCNLSGANILTASVRGARLERINFIDHDLRGLDLRDTSLVGCDLSGQSFSRSDLSGAVFDNCRLESADLSYANCCKTSFTEVDFRNTKMVGAQFREANLARSNFAAVSLEDVNFEDADLSQSDLREAILKHTNFSKSDITGCALWKVQAADWELSRVKCSHAFWDKDAKEKTHYATHEFERIYAESITIELRYPFRVTANEIATLPILIEHLTASHWGTAIRLKSIQDVAGGALVTLSVDETGRYHPSELKDTLQDEANRIQMALIALRHDTKLQAELKEEIARIKEDFWPRLLELAAESEREQVRNLTIVFMDLKGFSKWGDDELSEKLALFRGLVKPILTRWHAGYPNMEGDSLRVTFRNATAGLACACMLRNVLTGAGFECRLGVELGEVAVVHNEVTDISDLEGSAVSMAARLEATAETGEILVTDRVRHYTAYKGIFDFIPKKVGLKKSIGAKKEGDIMECYAVKLLKHIQEIS